MEQWTAEAIRDIAENWRMALEAITAPDNWQAEMIEAIEAQPWPPIAEEWHLEPDTWPELDTWPPIDQGGG